jgi:hypothetical protein
MNKYNTIFGQILDYIPRSDFQKLVKEHDSDKGNKGFSTWAHFATMLFAQVSGQNGLRSIENGINHQSTALYHLGIPKLVKRSTISYSNKNREADFFEQLFYTVLQKVQKQKQNHGFRFKNPLYSIDATTIDLCLKLFPWADFREKKAGIKITVKLDHRGKIPCFAVISTAKEHESQHLKKIPLQPGDVAAIDRGFTNYSYFASLCNKKISFITRMKSNAIFSVVKENPLPASGTILSDEVILLTGYKAKKECPFPLRRIVSEDPETKKQITILTNNLFWAASTIAAVYKDRWQIELFFKAMKQNLKIKRFYGTSKNAVLIQIWIALIAYLLFSLIKFATKSEYSFSLFISVISTILFQRRLLFEWLMISPPPLKRQSVLSLQLELI